MWLRNAHTTSNRRWFDVDNTSVCQKENIDKFPRHFDIHFYVIFMGQRLDIVLTYFLRCNFDEQKIDIVSTYFGRRNFDEQVIAVISMYYFRPEFDGRKINVVLVYLLVQFRWKTNVTWEQIFWYDFERQKLWSFWYLFLISWYIKN